MRTSTFLSFLVAAILGIAAVVGVRSWLAEQRAELSTSRTSPAAETSQTVVVAKEAMAFGERLVPAKLEVIPWGGATLPDGSFRTVEEIGDNTDETARFALSSIEKGEPVLATRITNPGQRAKLSTAITPGLKALSIRVNDVAGVAGFVLPGDRVDILLTRSDNSKVEEAYVDVLLQGVQVLAIDQIVDERKDQPSVVRTVTVEVSTEEAQKLTLGSSIGTLSLALRNVVSSDVEANQRVTLAEMSKSTASATLEAELAAVAEAARAAAEGRVSEQESRIASLEEMVRSLGGNVDARLEELKEELKKPATVEVIAEPVVVEPPKPEFVTIGVVRNGERQDYLVASENE